MNIITAIDDFINEQKEKIFFFAILKNIRIRTKSFINLLIKPCIDRLNEFKKSILQVGKRSLFEK